MRLATQSAAMWQSDRTEKNWLHQIGTKMHVLNCFFLFVSSMCVFLFFFVVFGQLRAWLYVVLVSMYRFQDIPTSHLSLHSAGKANILVSW